MGKFVFPLQNILHIKTKLEETAKNAYGEARQKLSEEEAKLDELFIRRQDYEERLRMQINQTLKIREIISYENAIETIKYKEKMQQVIVKQHESLVEKARLAMQEAVTDRKTYELLREKEFEKFLVQLAKDEAKEIDELVSYKFNQTSKEV